MMKNTNTQSNASDVFVRFLIEADEGKSNPESLFEDYPELKPALQKKLQAYKSIRQALSIISPHAVSQMNIPWGSISLTGKTIGDFKLIREIGRGGIGIVYLANQISLNRLVALKVIPPRINSTIASLKRFVREARSLAKLHHPNIVTIYTAGEQDGYRYLAMDYVRGIGMDDLIRTFSEAKGNPLRAKDVEKYVKACLINRGFQLDTKESIEWESFISRLLGAVCSALSHAHEAGVVHRDIKPSNILIDETGIARVIDFGLTFEADAPALTLTAELFGTPYYMAPEQIEGVKTSSIALVDVYGVGASFYEMLTLARPFDGGNIAKTLKLIQKQEPKPPRLINSQIAPDLEAIVLKAMEKSPRRRYAAMKDFSEDVTRHLQHQPVAARLYTPFTRFLKTLRRHRKVVFTSILISLLALGFGWQRLMTGKSQKAQSTLMLEKAEIRRLGNRPEESLEIIREAISLNPRSPKPYIEKARTYLQMKKTDEAIQELNEALRRAPNDYEAKAYLAMAHSDRGEHEKALAIDEEIIDQAPADLEVLATYAARLSHLGRTAEAIKAIESRYSKHSGSFSANLMMGKLLRDQGEKKKALPYLEKAVALNPKYISSVNLLAWNYFDLADYSKCVITASNGLEVQPKDIGLVGVKALALFKLKKYQESENQYRVLAALEPKNPQHQNGISMVLWEQGRMQESIQAQKIAIELGDQSSMTYSFLASKLAGANQHHEALLYYEKALKADPGNAQIRANYLQQKQFIEADPAAKIVEGVTPEGYVNKEYGLFFKYPKEWVVAPLKGPLVNFQDPHSQAEYAPRINVTVGPYDGELKAAAEELIEIFNDGGWSAKVDSFLPVKERGYQGIKQSFNTTILGRSVRSVALTVVANKMSYTFLCASELKDYPKYELVFENALKSIEVTDIVSRKK
ncbi:MAG: Serine/threonine-protein kinase PknD [Elusimicrobia bacterium]|nr:Serine/threonine-protein kinase PknD [Elusimicrobiota bacterium]